MSQGIRVLSRRNIESYMFDAEVLKSFAESTNKEKADEFLAEVARIREAAGANPNFKAIGGNIYNACQDILRLQCGNTQKFIREQLAPRIKKGMKVYDELSRDIFGDMDS